jgi:quercetin dioxygenase-like cupin family protein
MTQACDRLVFLIGILKREAQSLRSHNDNMVPYTFLENIETEVPIQDSIPSRTVFDDEPLKIVAFGFASGQELSVRTAPMAALLYFVIGAAELNLGGEKQNRAGALVYIPSQMPHGILARTPVAMLLLMLKQVRLERSS